MTIRISADEIERLIRNALDKFLASPKKIVEALGCTDETTSDIHIILARTKIISGTAQVATSKRLPEILSELIDRVIIGEMGVTLVISRNALRKQFCPGVTLEDQKITSFELRVPARLKPRGQVLKFVIIDGTKIKAPRFDTTLIRAVARAHGWLTEIMSGEIACIKERANREKLAERYVRRILNLAFLAPDITRSILGGTQPANLMLQDFMTEGAIPNCWVEQRQRFQVSQ